jgi:hypothetical protein
VIALRAKAQNRRYRRLVALTLVVLGLLLVWEHTGTEQGHAEHGHVGEVVSMCMAVLGGAVATLGISGLLALRRLPLPLRVMQPAYSHPRPAPVPRARAGPAELQVLLS